MESDEEKIIHRGIEIKIEQDTDPESPRHWDNLGVMVCFHRRYDLGDKADGAQGHGYTSSQFSSWAELAAQIERDHRPVAIAPLYLYDHSGLRIKVGSFQGLLPQGHAEFDSGQVGFIFVSREAALKEYSAKKITKALIEKVTKVLDAEVKTYDQYLSGDVWGYVIEGVVQKTVMSDGKGGHVERESIGDSCWGFYGYDYCLAEARSAAENYADRAEAEVQAENNQGAGI